ncbi:CDC9 ATP-dependent DNA ligase [uncultured Caudovirales phage]|uniref:DNA ligase n=1 Tax=uncultured Caudovirales phage TaxID=2100421 RepID=A0A6J5L938_9CAUD|nr:CDC9 ATP-dependent DNA ligase [uncultured Caudovirales phage]
MLKPWEVIAELEADNSRLAKEAIVKREALAGNAELFRGFRAAYDAMITFGVKKVEEKSGDGKGITAEAFWKTADRLTARDLTGNEAQTAINFLRMNAREQEWNLWYRRILIKDMRCGTSDTTVNKIAGKINGNYIVPVFSCQLAHDGANHDSKVSGKKLVEVKLDGVRVITIVYPSGHVDQYSRNGKELVNFEHIKRQFAKHAIFFKEPMVLDGEVMSSSFQDLMRQVHRKSDVKATDAVLNLFDILTLQDFQAGVCRHSQQARSDSLRAWYTPIQEHMPNVTVLGQELVDLDTDAGQTRFKEINTSAIAGGYEGIMIKDPAAGYETKRSVAWLKQKPYIEVSLAVVGVEEGTGKNVGRLGALIVEGTDDGKPIRTNVGSGLTDSDRITYWDNADSLIGNIVEVRADAVTQNQDGSYSLRFPRFKGFRGFTPGEKL